MSREGRMALQEKLFNFYYTERRHDGLTPEQLKIKMAELIVDHFGQQEKTNPKPLSKSVQISEQELAHTIWITGGKEGYERLGSELPYELWLQTQTDTYKANFGNKPPKLLYHGTNADFEQFNDQFIQLSDRATHGQNFGNAHYFTDNQRFAEGYGTVKTVLVNTQNFFNASEVYDYSGNWREEEQQQRDQVYLLLGAKAQAGLNGEPKELESIVAITRNMALNDKPITDSEVYRNTARHVYEKAGFDGVIFNRSDERNEVIAYFAKNIIHTISKEQIEKAENSLYQVQKSSLRMK